MVSKAPPQAPATQRPLHARHESREHASPNALSFDPSRFSIHPRAGAVLQTKLTIGSAGDSYEREADQVAQRIARMSEPPLNPIRTHALPAVQRQCSCGGTCAHCQQDAADEERGHLQREVSGGGRAIQTAPAIVHQVLRSAGQPLAASTRAFFEPRLGFDFSKVRIHIDGQAGASAQAIQANAYTVGSNIVFASGHFAPESAAGRSLLAHELTHVVQQSGGSASQFARPSHAGEPTRISPAAPTTVQRQPALPDLDPVDPADEGDFVVEPTQPSNDNSLFGRSAANDNDLERESGPPQSRLHPHYRPASTEFNWSRAFSTLATERESQSQIANLERPVADLTRGGSPPDFITVAKEANTSRFETGPEVSYFEHSFHILDAIEYAVAHAKNNQELANILLSSVRDVDFDTICQVVPKQKQFPLLEVTRWAPMTGVFIPGNLDPAGAKRLAAFRQGLIARQVLAGPKVQPATQTQPNPQAAPALALATKAKQKSKPRTVCPAHLYLPIGKLVHFGLYQTEVAASRLAMYPTEFVGRQRTSAYQRESEQVKKWFDGMDPAKGGQMDGTLLRNGTDMLKNDQCRPGDMGCEAEQRRRVLRPNWAPGGEPTQMDVDHIMELQLSAIQSPEAFDVFDNYELLDSRTNSSAGSTLDKSLQAERKRIRQQCPDYVPNWGEVAIVFDPPVLVGGGRGPGKRWSREQILRGDHLKDYKPGKKKK